MDSKAMHTKNAAVAAVIYRFKDAVGSFPRTAPAAAAVGINAIMYPNVGDITMPGPPFPPENTGIASTSPMNTYINMDKPALFAPKSNPAITHITV